MPQTTLDSLLDRLAELKRSFGPQDGAHASRILKRLARRRFPNADTLLRFHEILLFMRAYPHNPAIVRETEQLLASFKERVERLQRAGADLSPLTVPEASGVAGTSFSAQWGYDILRHLAARHASATEIDWEDYGEAAALINVLKLFLPLFADGAYAESPVPYLTWLRAAKSEREHDLAWLLRRFAEYEATASEKAALFDSLKLWVRWELRDSRATRTHMRRRVRRIFYHNEALLARRDVSLARELEDETPLPVARLSRAAGEHLLDEGRDTMAVRYRELHGFSYGDARHVFRVEAGRGVEFFIWGVPAAHRLPLLAYHAALIYKNGVPAGYAESLALCERTECGLNLFYTFRDGESAWIYARLLRLFRQHLGVTVFSIDPYQLGFHNEEGIESGSFWFYRKQGFRPVRAALARMVAREESKLATRANYRTPPRVLHQLAAGHLLYEIPAAANAGEWDNFHIRHIGLNLQRRMAHSFGSDERRMRHAAAATVARALNVNPARWKPDEQRALDDLALVLAQIPSLSRWPTADKRAVTRIIRAKASADETQYLRLLQQHARLRAQLIKLGSVDSIVDEQQ